MLSAKEAKEITENSLIKDISEIEELIKGNASLGKFTCWTSEIYDQHQSEYLKRHLNNLDYNCKISEGTYYNNEGYKHSLLISWE